MTEPSNGMKQIGSHHSNSWPWRLRSRHFRWESIGLNSIKWWEQEVVIQKSTYCIDSNDWRIILTLPFAFMFESYTTWYNSRRIESLKPNSTFEINQLRQLMNIEEGKWILFNILFTFQYSHSLHFTRSRKKRKLALPLHMNFFSFLCF